MKKSKSNVWREAPKAVFYLVLTYTTAIMADDASTLVSSGNGLFARNLYQVLAQKEGNVFFSPLSAHAVLSLAYQGATGATANAFAKTLNLPVTKSAADGYKSVMSSLNSVPNVTLHIANKIFVHGQYLLKDSFKSVATDSFLSDAENVEFSDNVAAAQRINNWVLDKTNNKIVDLIQPDDLDDLTRLVLVNAIYFKGDWLYKFNPASTVTQPFYVSDKDTVDCDMMHTTKNFDYGENANLDAKVLRMPYANKDVSLVIILPNSRTGIKGLEAKLAQTDFVELTNGLRNVEVQVSLPKFKIETTIELNEPLKQLGLGVIFSDDAEFPNMIESPEPLKVSKVVQKAFIEVNEEGAEAAAATGLIMVPLSLPLQPLTFNANHPFIILLESSTGGTNHVLFVGRIANPSK